MILRAKKIYIQYLTRNRRLLTVLLHIIELLKSVTYTSSNNDTEGRLKDNETVSVHVTTEHEEYRQRLLPNRQSNSYLNSMKKRRKLEHRTHRFWKQLEENHVLLPETNRFEYYI